MTATAVHIAAYINTRFEELPRDWSSIRLIRSDQPMFAPRPSVETFAKQLYGEAEFLALQLGDFLSTDRGELVAEAIELVSPPFYRADERLIVDALTEGARLHARGLQWGGALAVASGGFLVYLATQMGRAATPAAA